MFGGSAKASPTTLQPNSVAVTELKGEEGHNEKSEFGSNLRDAKAFSLSEVFIKLQELEEEIRKLNGILQQLEREHADILKRLEGQGKSEKPSQIRDEAEIPSQSVITTARNLIKDGNNAEAIKVLKSHLQSKSQNVPLEDEGEIYYLLAKAHMNEKSSSKASYYFAKSYRYNSEVKSKDILVSLIDALVLDKKHKQTCPLLGKLDDKYLNSISSDKSSKLRDLKRTYC
jgi:TolA-binding protein